MSKCRHSRRHTSWTMVGAAGGVETFPRVINGCCVDVGLTFSSTLGLVGWLVVSNIPAI